MLVNLDFEKQRAFLYQKTAEKVGDEFVVQYSFENAQQNDLFWQMFQINLKV